MAAQRAMTVPTHGLGHAARRQRQRRGGAGRPARERYRRTKSRAPARRDARGGGRRADERVPRFALPRSEPHETRHGGGRAYLRCAVPVHGREVAERRGSCARQAHVRREHGTACRRRRRSGSAQGHTRVRVIVHTRTQQCARHARRQTSALLFPLPRAPAYVVPTPAASPARLRARRSAAAHTRDRSTHRGVAGWWWRDRGRNPSCDPRPPVRVDVAHATATAATAATGVRARHRVQLLSSCHSVLVVGASRAFVEVVAQPQPVSTPGAQVRERRTRAVQGTRGARGWQGGDPQMGSRSRARRGKGGAQRAARLRTRAPVAAPAPLPSRQRSRRGSLHAYAPDAPHPSQPVCVTPHKHPRRPFRASACASP